MPRRALLSNPVDSISELSAKHTTHGTAIGELLFPNVGVNKRPRVLVASLGIELAPDVDDA